MFPGEIEITHHKTINILVGIGRRCICYDWRCSVYHQLLPQIRRIVQVKNRNRWKTFGIVQTEQYSLPSGQHQTKQILVQFGWHSLNYRLRHCNLSFANYFDSYKILVMGIILMESCTNQLEHFIIQKDAKAWE